MRIGLSAEQIEKVLMSEGVTGKNTLPGDTLKKAISSAIAANNEEIARQVSIFLGNFKK